MAQDEDLANALLQRALAASSRTRLAQRSPRTPAPTVPEPIVTTPPSDGSATSGPGPELALVLNQLQYLTDRLDATERQLALRGPREVAVQGPREIAVQGPRELQPVGAAIHVAPPTALAPAVTLTPQLVPGVEVRPAMLGLPPLPPAANTFGPGQLATTPADLDATMVELMRVEDLADTFGTERRLREESLLARQRRFQEEQQRHYDAYHQAEQRLAEEARRRAEQLEHETQARAAQLEREARARAVQLEHEARQRAAALTEAARVQELARLRLEGEAKEQVQRAADLQRVEQRIQTEAELQAQQRASAEAQLERQRRELAEFELRLRREREQLEAEHQKQMREHEALRFRKEELSARRQQVSTERKETEAEFQARLDEAVREALERGRREGRLELASYQPPTAQAPSAPAPSLNAQVPPSATAPPATPPTPPLPSAVPASPPSPQVPSAQTTPWYGHVNKSLGGPRVPPNKDSKMSIRNFDGTELYVGLGGAFKQWAELFKQELAICEQSCGYRWTEEFKIVKLGQHLRGKAALYFENQRAQWIKVSETLDYAIAQMSRTFNARLGSMQTATLLHAKKPTTRSWTDHFLYLVAARNATGASPALILENIVLHADEDMTKLLLPKWNRERTDYEAQASELVNWAQEIEETSKGRKKLGQQVGSVSDGRNKDDRKCHKCGKKGHIKRDCRARDNEDKDAPAKGTHFKGKHHVMAVGDSQLDDPWIFDSGACRHLVADRALLYDEVECEDEQRLVQPDGSPLEATVKGKTDIYVNVDGEVSRLTLTNVWYAPQIKHNLISYGCLVRSGGCLGVVEGRHALLRDGEVVCYLKVARDILVVDGVVEFGGVSLGDVVMAAVEEVQAGRSVQRGTLMEFHHRFGHISYDTIERMANDPRSGIELTSTQRKNCLTCAEGKQTRAEQPKQDTGESAPTDRVGAVICSDIKGPISPRDRNANRYMINFVDHRSNYCRVFLAPTKDKAAQKFKHFLVWFEKRFDCRIHVLRTDGGAEYNNVDLFCEETGVTRQKTEAKNQAGNGKAERMHRTIMNMVRCMLFSSTLPLNFWGYAAQYASYVLNRLPTRSNPQRKTPLEMLEGKVPTTVDVVVFGTSCTVFRDPGKNSLKKRGEPGYIVGKNDETKGFRVYLPKDHTVVTTRHVKNLETLSDEGNQKLKELLEREAEEELEELARERQEQRKAADAKKAATANEQEGGAEEPTSSGPATRKQRKSSKPKTHEEKALRRSTRQRKKSARQKEAEEGAAAARGTIALVLAAMEVAFGEDVGKYKDLPDPNSYSEALKSPDRQWWIKAHDEELAALLANKTWTIVRATREMKRLHSKWVHKKKRLANGDIERYKARLVARGDEQVLGRDYVLVFAAVMDMVSAKFVLALAAVWGVPARHFDVPSAYLKASVEDEYDIYLHPPQGMKFTDEELRQYGVSRKEELALRLDRSLYGLKQAGRLWHELLKATLIEKGFVQSLVDSCIFYKKTETGIVVVGVYVDDLLATATTPELLDDFHSDMKALELKDLGLAQKFLGIGIVYDADRGYELEQSSTIAELLVKFKLDKANSVQMPIGDEMPSEQDEKTVLPNDGPGTVERPTVKLFQSLVGSLLWIARCTRPDIAYAVHRATRRAHAPTMTDWKLAKRTLRYLSGSADMVLTMKPCAGQGGEVQIASVTDADFAGDRVDRKSTSGVMVKINGMLVAWQAKKQGAVALSTAEAEFTAAAAGAKEILGLRQLSEEIGLKVETPMRMEMDNQAAIKQVESEASSAQSKHVDVKLKFVRDYKSKSILQPVYVDTKNMQADVLTKPLPAPRLRELRAMIGLK